MANQTTKPQKGAKTGGKTKERKLLLKSLFVAAPVIIEPEEPQKVVVAGLVEARIKKEYPETYFGRAWAVFRGEFQTMLKVSLFFILFTLPFVLVLAVASGYFEDFVLGGSFNFMSGIGIGYPGGGDNIGESVSKLLWDVKQPILMMLAGAGIIASIGMGGMFYATKRSYFQDLYKRITRTYFIGVSKYWWKFILVSTFGILVALAMGTAMLFLLSQNAVGAISAGAYCGVIFSFLFGIPLLAYCMVVLSLIAVYEMKFKDTLKNALVIMVNCPLMVALTGVLSAVPLLLLIMDSVAATVIIYIVMAFAGFALIALCWTGFASKCMTKCTVLNDLEQKRTVQVQKVQAKQKVNTTSNV
ncbi:MAG: hypothetical protein RSC44_03065, partial [Clostridia bacterium]